MPPVRRVSTPHGKGPPQGETIQVEPKPQMTPAPDILGSIQVTARKPVRPVIQVQQPARTLNAAAAGDNSAIRVSMAAMIEEARKRPHHDVLELSIDQREKADAAERDDPAYFSQGPGDEGDPPMLAEALQHHKLDQRYTPSHCGMKIWNLL
ncbi:hypothetical protein EJ06DRAFT_522832 [Trichodelitschia bisporula]|uniref:Uncharacterized protein n=1 Tax=Trichodelitschia bisporula TaxID=703511 RepID=A0A6G1HTL2_9PEZI|nr:hypothetical protein EJ06DRAFT_522832 [Trichodelitschia bisporula]